MLGERSSAEFAADTVVGSGLLGDPEYVESVLTSLPPAVQESLRRVLGSKTLGKMTTNEAFIAGAATVTALGLAAAAIQAVDGALTIPTAP
jgi:hypothetical protein